MNTCTLCKRDTDHLEILDRGNGFCSVDHADSFYRNSVNCSLCHKRIEVGKDMVIFYSGKICCGTTCLTLAHAFETLAKFVR